MCLHCGVSQTKGRTWRWFSQNGKSCPHTSWLPEAEAQCHRLLWVVSPSSRKWPRRPLSPPLRRETQSPAEEQERQVRRRWGDQIACLFSSSTRKVRGEGVLKKPESSQVHWWAWAAPRLNSRNLEGERCVLFVSFFFVYFSPSVLFFGGEGIDNKSRRNVGFKSEHLLGPSPLPARGVEASWAEQKPGHGLQRLWSKLP